MDDEKLDILKQQLKDYSKHKETKVDYGIILGIFVVMFVICYFATDSSYLFIALLGGGSALFYKVIIGMDLSDKEISKKHEIEQEIGKLENEIKRKQEEKQKALYTEICKAAGFSETDHTLYNWYANNSTNMMVYFFVDKTDCFVYRNGENIYTYKLADINNVEILSEKYTNTTSIAKKSNGSMLGRAVVGSVVAGGVGAVIGGLSGTSTIESNSQEYAMNTRVRVSLNSVELPYFTIYTASEEVSRGIRDIIVAIKNSYK